MSDPCTIWNVIYKWVYRLPQAYMKTQIPHSRWMHGCKVQLGGRGNACFPLGVLNLLSSRKPVKCSSHWLYFFFFICSVWTELTRAFMRRQAHLTHQWTEKLHLKQVIQGESEQTFCHNILPQARCLVAGHSILFFLSPIPSISNEVLIIKKHIWYLLQ